MKIRYFYSRQNCNSIIRSLGSYKKGTYRYDRSFIRGALPILGLHETSLIKRGKVTEQERKLDSILRQYNELRG